MGKERGQRRSQAPGSAVHINGIISGEGGAFAATRYQGASREEPGQAQGIVLDLASARLVGVGRCRVSCGAME